MDKNLKIGDFIIKDNGQCGILTAYDKENNYLLMKTSSNLSTGLYAENINTISPLEQIKFLYENLNEEDRKKISISFLNEVQVNVSDLKPSVWYSHGNSGYEYIRLVKKTNKDGRTYYTYNEYDGIKNNTINTDENKKLFLVKEVGEIL